mmetsp:Transcript_15042/g.45530  ORF Transcript_15042/g.45530 Transcript_15042/m.45530 type:complete len:83 (+) Transcript_15042:416-664(+)
MSGSLVIGVPVQNHFGMWGTVGLGFATFVVFYLAQRQIVNCHDHSLLDAALDAIDPAADRYSDLHADVARTLAQYSLFLSRH